MLFLPNRKKEDVMLVNAMYHNKKAGVDQDYLNLIYKNLKTGEKFLEVIPSPTIDIYFAKEEYQDYNYVKSFIELDKVEKHTCLYNGLSFYIADQAGKEYKDYLYSCMETKNWSAMNNIHKYPYVFGSDIEIENWVRIQWLLHNDHDNPKPVTKMYLDIETDTIDIPGFPEDGECPINAITIVDEEDLGVYTFLLRNKKNPLIAEFEKNIESFIETCNAEFDEFYGKLTYNIYMYDEDDELELLKDVFRLINTLKRDFLMAWNQVFDFPYIIERIIKLGGIPEEIMCHKDFPVKTVNYIRDMNNKDFKNRADFLKVSSYTVFLDQMTLYAGLRKGMGEQRSYALTAVAETEIRDSKLDYKEEADIKTLPYVNFIKFVMYNIKDVLLQLGIERKTGDVDNIYQRSYTNATSYNKIFRQTVFLKSRAYVEFYKQGLIIGNNGNIDYSRPRDKVVEKKEREEKFDGALVSNPLLNLNTGIKILGRKSKFVFDNVVDFDFKAMYPFIIIAFNVSPSSMIGKLLINSGIDDLTEEVIEEQQLDDRGKEFMDNLLVNNPANLCSKWFGLPDIVELDKIVRKEFGIKKSKVLDMNKSHSNVYHLETVVIE